MANPNPVKQVSHRRHPDNQLPAMDPTASRRALNITEPYVARQRLPGEAMPYASSVMDKRNIYRPSAWVAPIR